MKKKLPKWPKSRIEKLIEQLLNEIIFKVRNLRIPRRKDDKMFLTLYTIIWLGFGYLILREWINILGR